MAEAKPPGRPKKRSPVPIDFPGKRKHGTVSGYTAGCGCEPCTAAMREYQREKKRRNREKKAEEIPHGYSGYINYDCRCDICKLARREYALSTNYGITLEQYDRMLEAQNHLCAVCGRPPNGTPLHVDHDHQTGVVRGLLCYQCNTVLGLIDDDPHWHLERMIGYIDHPPAATVLGGEV